VYPGTEGDDNYYYENKKQECDPSDVGARVIETSPVYGVDEEDEFGEETPG
jgi:hypothetical protein